MSSFFNDIKYSIRVLKRKPGFFAAAVFCLALGIGGVTAVLSVFDGMFVDLLPYKDADRLVVFDTRFPGVDRSITATAALFYQQWRTETDCFEDMGAYFWHTSHHHYEGWRDTEEHFKDLKGFHVTPSLPSVLGVKPVLGRFFDDTETNFDEYPLVIISHHVWRDRYRSDPQVLGQTVRLGGHSCRIIGVMPSNIKFLPSLLASLTGTFSTNNTIDYWIPMPKVFSNLSHVDISYDVIGRLKKDVTLAAAQAQIDVLVQRQYEEHLAAGGLKSISTTLVSLRAYLLGSVNAGLWLLMAAAGFVLLIACANVTNLLLIHNLGRAREMAVCAALGGTRAHWLRQRLMDSILIALSGGLLGVLFAFWGIQLLVALAPGDLPGLDQIRLDIKVLGVTLGISLLCGLVVGALSALRITRSNLSGLLKGISWSSGAVGVRERRTLGGLGMVEVALALVLLLGTTLTLRSFWRIMQVDLGVKTDNILCARVMGPDLTQNHQALVDSLKNLPGIEAVATVTSLPLTEETPDLAILGDVAEVNIPADAMQEIFLRTISQDYFRVMGIQLLQGREFDTQDTRTSDRVIVINQRLAQHLWPQTNPLGQHIRFKDVHATMGTGISKENKQAAFRVVGVVQDVKYHGPETDAAMEGYLLMAQGFRRHLVTSLALRCGAASTAYAEAIKGKVEATCPGCAVTGFSTMQDFYTQHISVRRFVMTLLLCFAGIALSLAVIGIYSVTACTVSARMREVGIRKAFGADRMDVLRLILKQGMVWVLGGLGLGLLLALMLRQAIASQLFGISAIDPVAIVVGILVILLVSLTACMLPAYRAAKTDPMEVLRYE